MTDPAQSPQSGGHRSVPKPVEGFGSSGTHPGPASGAAAGAATGPKGSAVPGVSGGGGASKGAATSRTPASQHRAEGLPGGVSSAHSGGASGEASPVVPPTQRRGPMQTVVVLRRIDPWSAFTTVLGLMCALYLVWMVAVGVVYLLLSGMGVWDRLGGLLSGVAGDGSADAIGASTIFLYAGGVGLLNVLLLSVLAALAVFIYNLAAGLTGGGVQVTLADRRR